MTKYSRYVQGVITWATEHLNLQEWQITFSLDQPIPDEETAEVAVTPKYVRAHIKLGDVARGYFETPYSWSLAHAIAHEVCHILTERMYLLALVGCTAATQEQVHDLREADTERLANIIMKSMPKRVWMVPK
jgi:hypothetical protein